jgi:hypothetical protein
MKKILLLTFITSLFEYANATHIIGGEMSYRCLGNNDYEITLKLYRDCYNGVPWFDIPTTISIFDIGGNAVSQISIVNPASDTLDVQTNCAAFIPYICAEQGIFIDTVNLPPITGGYTLAYQRCCRSMIIQNILDPLNVGMTVSATIPDASIAACNNSPVFINNPPFAFCIGIPINFDHSAVDPDGDSLVYELCSGVSGADQYNPYPVPAYPPPYTDVPYNYPYSGTYPFDTYPALDVNPQTGLLTGTPTSVGIFSLSVCIKEYRNGNLLGIHRRELAQVFTIDGAANPTPVEEVSANKIDLFPNPASDQVTVDLGNVPKPADEIILYNVLGSVVNKFSCAGAKSTSINVRDFRDGLYFIHIITDHGDVVQPFTVQH